MMGECETENNMDKWQNSLDTTGNERTVDIHQIQPKQYNVEGTTNVWQKSKQSNLSHCYDPFREDEPSVCALETLHQNSTMRKHLYKAQSFDMNEINVDVPYHDYPSNFQLQSDPDQYFIWDDIPGAYYDPIKADEYLVCQDFLCDISEAVITEMGKAKRKWRFMSTKQQGNRQPIHVDSMEDTLNKLKKSDITIKGKPNTLTIPKSNTTSSIGTRDGDKTPSGAFRPIKSDPVLGTQMDNPSREASTQCKEGKSAGVKGGMVHRQKRTMSMPEAPSKGKLKKLQSQISSVFKKRESYPHDEAYTRYSRKRYVSSSSSSSDTSSPIIVSCTSSPEVFEDDEPYGRINIDVEEIEKEASEFEDILEPRWVPQPSHLISHGLVHQSSQEECTETDDLLISKTGEYLIKEAINDNSNLVGSLRKDEELCAVNDGSIPDSHAAISVGKQTGSASSCSGGRGVSGSGAQLQISRHLSSPPALGTMNNEFQLTDSKFGAVSSATIDPRAGARALGVAALCSPDDKGINHDNPISSSPEQGYITAQEMDDPPDVLECQNSHDYDDTDNNNSLYFSCDDDDKSMMHIPSPGVVSTDSQNVIITASLPVGPSLIPHSDSMPMLMDAPPPRDTPPLDAGQHPCKDGGNPGADAEMGEEEEEDGEANYSQHVAASLVNNSLAIMLLLDHKLASGSFQFSPSTEDSLLQDEGPEEGSPEGDIDAVQFQYQDPDENLEEDNLLMARTLHYMRRQDNQDLDRSKSFGNSVTKAFNEAVSKLEMGHDSRNKQFHKLFPCVPDSESVINTYSCALVKDILLQGRMFVSENWICFHSNIFSYEKQIAIKVETISKITKERTAFVVPNAIGLHTPSEKHIFGSLLSRHSTHQLLYRVWKNAKGETESMSPGSSLQGDSDEEDIPVDSEDDVEDLDLEHDGPNGRVLPPVSVHDYQRLESQRFSDSYGGSHPGQGGSPRQPRLPSDQSHSMGDSPNQGHRSHTGYHHQLCQMLCSVSIFKSIMRLGSSLKQLPQYQPFLLLIGILLLCLTFSAAVLTIRIWRLQPHNTTPSQTSAHESVHLENMENIGELYLSEQHKHQEKVSHIQDTLSANLKALLQVQSSLQHLSKKSPEDTSSHPGERLSDIRQREDL